MFKTPTINTIDSDISNVSIYFRSTKKFGKTTMFRNVVLAKFGDPSKGLLVGVGNEQGYDMLDQLNVSHVYTYKDFVDCIDWLINEKGKSHDIQMVAFDTVDELTLLAEAETIKISNREDDKCKTINGAFGGYNRGPKYAAHNLIKPQISRLKQAGFGVWEIAHTKFKATKDKGSLDEDGFMQLTSNLATDYESIFGDISDIVLTGNIERSYTTKTVKQGKKTVTKKYVTDSERRLYFRGNLSLDAGGRFADGSVPDYMVIDTLDIDTAQQLIKYIEDGLEYSKIVNADKRPYLNTQTEKQIVEESIDSDIEDEVDVVDADIDDDEDGMSTTEEIASEVRGLFKACTDRELKTTIKQGIKEYGSLEDCPIEVLQDFRRQLTT